MTGSPFDGLFTSICKDIRRSITGKENCASCKKRMKIKDMKETPWYSYLCPECYSRQFPNEAKP